MSNKEDLQVGEWVVLLDYYGGVAGRIVERLNHEYVRVKWAGFSTPTTHRDQPLTRLAGGGAPLESIWLRCDLRCNEGQVVVTSDSSDLYSYPSPVPLSTSAQSAGTHRSTPV